MLRRGASLFKLKRKRSPFVHKFLEGCPVPATLIDDLAGANLRSSAPFFSTTPRYIVETEKRLSKMFFHHSLYPAGGARRPYRVVVVRGGRGVRNQSVAVSSAGGDNGSWNESHRLHKDPARRPFFYSKSTLLPPSPNPSAHKSSRLHMVGEKDSQVGHNSASAESRVNSVVRPVEDSLLEPLCGVIENHFADLLRQQRWVAGNRDQEGATDADETMSKTLEVLLSGGHGGVVMTREEEQCGSSGGVGGGVMERLLSSASSFASSFFYVHAHLPSSALFLKETAEETLSSTGVGAQVQPKVTSTTAVMQLAGAFVPAVHFAVGSPLVVRCSATHHASPTSTNVPATVVPFGHIQCLLRVRTKSPQAQSAKKNTNPQDPPHSVDAPSTSADCLRRNTQGIVEPWKLGVSLDPVVPFYMRTITEKCPISSSSGHATSAADAEISVDKGAVGFLLGRDDCETYLLPQRELLFTFHTPSEVVAMCAEQNEERMRRQAGLGYTGFSHAFTEGPRTAGRVLQGAYCNLTAAERGAMGHDVAGMDVQERKRNSTVYEVRALPGDAVFVPRGWRYSVERIIGTAVIHAAATSLSQHAGPSPRAVRKDVQYGALKTSFMHTAVMPESMRGGVGVDGAEAEAETVEGTQVATCGRAHVVGVDVDAFVLCYKPYPVLSAAQAAAYVSANYVHGGIDEFYAKGGNNVFHKYK